MDKTMKVSIVGIGPGSREDMTFRAYSTLEAADIIVGYKTYVNLVAEDFPQKEFYTTGMRGEVDRCQKAIDLALEGKHVAVISSGDAGVFGMASLVLELAKDQTDLVIEVVPGVTAASSGAALLGAPLAHDFACISLSDQLTPWSLIEERLHAASKADLCLALYNPRSNERPDHLLKALEIIMQYKPGNTVAGYAKKISRPGEEFGVTTLEGLKDLEADMQTTVFVGNKETQNLQGKMVTLRGYRL